MQSQNTPTLASYLASLGGRAADAANSATPEAIVAHQDAARAAFVDGFDRMPRLLAGSEDAARRYLSAFGFTLDDAHSDDLFLGVVPPTGWSIRPTHMAFFCEVADTQGCVRFRVYYKAAHYDREAYIEPNRRFDPTTVFLLPDGGIAERSELASHVRRVVRDARGGFAYQGALLTCSNRRKATSEEHRNHIREYDASGETARAWLDAAFPDWRDPAAHWDDDARVSA